MVINGVCVLIGGLKLIKINVLQDCSEVTNVDVLKKIDIEILKKLH